MTRYAGFFKWKPLFFFTSGFIYLLATQEKPTYGKENVIKPIPIPTNSLAETIDEPVKSPQLDHKLGHLKNQPIPQAQITALRFRTIDCKRKPTLSLQDGDLEGIRIDLDLMKKEAPDQASLLMRVYDRRAVPKMLPIISVPLKSEPASYLPESTYEVSIEIPGADGGSFSSQFLARSLTGNGQLIRNDRQAISFQCRLDGFTDASKNDK